MQITAHARTVNALLEAKGYTLADFIADRRDEGLSYRKTAQALNEFTEGVVDVTGETIRNWDDTLRSLEAAS